MTSRRLDKVAVAVVAISVVLVVGLLVYDAATADIDDYVEWCDERGGELHNANVIGEHGGLHCELENGTAVHLSDVDTDAGGESEGSQ